MERILRFPDRCVGYLWHDAPAGEELARIGPAEGVVRLSSEARVHFVVTEPTELACLQPLAPDGLVSIALNKTRVTDADLAALAPFEALAHINMSKARAVGDAGIRHLAGLRRLEVLDLYSTRVSDAGLVHLRALESLQHLHLGATRVRGSGLAWLSGLRALRRLSLERTRVDDASLVPLRDLPLKELVLAETLVTAQGAAEFQQRQPACRVHGYWDHNETALRASQRRRRLLSALVHRIVPKHPVAHTQAEEELLAVLKRLLPAGTRLYALGRDGKAVAGLTTGIDWEADADPERPIYSLLVQVPAAGQVGILMPGGSRYSVPWLVQRGPERRGRPRPVNRAAN